MRLNAGQTIETRVQVTSAETYFVKKNIEKTRDLRGLRMRMKVLEGELQGAEIVEEYLYDFVILKFANMSAFRTSFFRNLMSAFGIEDIKFSKSGFFNRNSVESRCRQLVGRESSVLLTDLGDANKGVFVVYYFPFWSVGMRYQIIEYYRVVFNGELENNRVLTGTVHKFNTNKLAATEFYERNKYNHKTARLLRKKGHLWEAIARYPEDTANEGQTA